MRTCTTCEQAKPDSEFSIKNAEKGWRNSRCKACKREYNKAWYQKNKKSHKKAVYRNNQKRRRRYSALIQRMKDVPCSDCERKYPPYVMDFDRVSGNKERAISRMVSDLVPRRVLLAEIDKCEVVCANCHRERTHARLRP